ncbi:MAG: chromosomal replication initiator protein DnaA [Ruminococcaceae bacterium]|nr:chromosomal replication initiator protein DnaA [Oscillospiraceae bacterium]
MKVESVQDIWELVCVEMKKNLSEIAFDVWLKDLHPIELKNGEFILGIYSAYKKNIVESNYIDAIHKHLKDIMGFEVAVTILVEDESGQVVAPPKPISDGSFESDYTFDNFIVGSTNRFAHAASMAVADNPNIIYNPLIIYGRSGVGKTHLLLAIKNHIRKKYPTKQIEYIRCEDFTNQLISALHEGSLGLGTLDSFRNRFRTTDVLLIDDIQFIAGKNQTQEEFFNTFNTLYQNKKQIVVTCDRPPKDIKLLDDRLRSRFESGLIADITPPDFETKVGIIKNKQQQLGIEIPENIIYYIAEHIQDNTRQLEGVVKKIQALIFIDQKVPTLSIVQGFIKEVVSDTRPEPIKIEQIITEVARTYNVSEGDILSTRRTADLVKARQVAMYIARETTELPYSAIGESFGKNHTTVLYTEKKVKELMKENPYEKTVIEDIIKNLKSE